MNERKAPLRLDSIGSLPCEFKHRLEPYKQEFERFEHIETVLENKHIRNIAEELSEYLCGQEILAYHCTKQPYPGYYETRGLRPTDIASHQNEFLQAFAGYFTSAELNFMRLAWSQYFVGAHISNRSGMIWMCLTKNLAISSGTKPFFTYYGGEVIYFPLIDHSTIAKKLKKIGQPVVVEVCVRGGNLRVFRELSEPLLGALHRKWRSAPTAPSDLECYQVIPIHPEAILSVRTLEDFSPKYLSR